MPIFTDDHETKVSLESGGSPLPDDMPFKLLLLGDWSGRSTQAYSLDSSLSDRRPVFVDRDNFEDVMRKMRVELTLNFEGGGANNALRLQFEELDDFHPDKIFRQIPLFADLKDTRKRLSNSQTFNEAAREVRSWVSSVSDAEEKPSQNENVLSQAVESHKVESDNFLDQILSQSSVAPENRSVAPVTASRELNALLGELVRPHLVQTDEAEQAKLIEAVDQATGELMRKILHHPDFQALEAAWRGAYLTVYRTETDTDLKLYLLDVSKDELKDDLKSVGNLTESAFYKLLSEPTRGNYGDETWAVVCANYVFNPEVDDAAALMRIAQIAADSETPFIAQAGARILGVESISETPDASDWRLDSGSKEAKLWAMLRNMAEAPYVGLAFPRLLARMPYGEKSEPTETFSFEEMDAVPQHNDYLWTNPVFAVATLLAQSFRTYGWEMERFHQDLENLPMHMYKLHGETKIKPCAEVEMTQNGAEKMMAQGLMPLISFRDSDRVRVGRLQSISDNSTALRGKWDS